MKNILVKKGEPYSVSGGVLTVGDVSAYRIIIDMGRDTSDMTAMAICQENGEFSADFDTDGTMIGVVLANSMYAEEGYITVRFAVSENSSVLTAKEIIFRVVPANNTETIAENHSGTLSDIMTAVGICRDDSHNALVISNQAIALATTKADADSVYTKQETDAKIASVYKYKGSVDDFNQLPSLPAVGDVYNIRYPYIKKAYGVNVISVADSGYGSYPEDEYVYMTVSDASVFSVGDTLTVFGKDGAKLGKFTVQSISGDELSEQFIESDGLYDMCSAIAFDKTGNADIYARTVEIGQTYYFSGIDPTEEFVEITYINAGDNVAWTGSEWDVLAGTTDLSAYATKDYVDTIIGTALEGEY